MSEQRAVIWRRRQWGRPDLMQFTAWHAWPADRPRSVCGLVPMHGTLPRVSLGRWLADAEAADALGVPARGRWCARCCRMLGLEAPPSRPELAAVEEAAVEFVGGVRDGQRVTLHLVSEAPTRFRVLPATYERRIRAGEDPPTSKEPWQA